MRRLFPILLVLTLGTMGCATSSGETTDNPDEPVGEVPEETDETPVWVKNPSVTKAEAQSGEAEGGPPEASRPAPERQPTEQTGQPAPPDTLDGVFPDERISIDFKEVSISRIMRVFQVKSDLNIVLTPKVEGRLTVSSDDARLVDAFRTVLEEAGLTFDRRPDAIVVSPK